MEALQKGFQAFITRMAENFSGGIDFGHDAIQHEPHAILHISGKGHFMRHQYHGHPLRRQRLDHPQYLGY